MTEKEINVKVEKNLNIVFKRSNYMDYLRVVGRLPNYNYKNHVLIFLKDRDANYLASSNVWGKLNRKIKDDVTEKNLIWQLVPKIRNEYIDLEGKRINGNIFTNNSKQEAIKTGRIIKRPVTMGYIVVGSYDISVTDIKDSTVQRDIKLDEFKVRLGSIGIDGLRQIVEKIIGEEIDADDYYSVSNLIRNVAIYLLNKKREENDIEMILTSGMEAGIICDSVAYAISTKMNNDVSDFTFDYIDAWYESNTEDESGRQKINRCIEYISKFTCDVINIFNKELGMSDVNDSGVIEYNEEMKKRFMSAALAYNTRVCAKNMEITRSSNG